MNRGRGNISNLRVVNVIATADLRQQVGLERLVCVEGFLYDKAIYQCAYLKDENTHGKISIFASGRMISVGTKSYRSARHDLTYCMERLVGLGLIHRTKFEPKLQNIVAVADLGRRVRLEAMASKMGHVIYEPEQFPSAIYYDPELQGASILIFASGKLVFAGLKSSSAFNAARKVLAQLASRL